MLEFKRDDLFVTVNEEVKSVYCGEESYTYTSKSQLFRVLYSLGLYVNEIRDLTGSHYSFVYGIVCGAGRDVKPTDRTQTKAYHIEQLYQQGLSVSEIAKQISTNYSYVFTVVKKYRSTHDLEQGVLVDGVDQVLELGEQNAVDQNDSIVEESTQTIEIKEVEIVCEQPKKVKNVQKYSFPVRRGRRRKLYKRLAK